MYLQLLYKLIISGLSGLILSSCNHSFDSTGYISGKPVHFQVDSRLAQLMIEDSSHSDVQNLYAKFRDSELNTETLAKVAKEYSLDVSALYFLYRIYQDSTNYNAFQDFNQIVYHTTPKKQESRMQKFKKYHFVFVPGFFYKKFPFSGADFKTQRDLFDKYGISYDFIETGEMDSVELNAEEIYNQLQKIQKTKKNIILVSASKGGLEVANVLGKYKSLDSVIGWISVCGIIRGCPIKEIFNSFPNNIIAPILFNIHKINPEPYKNLDSERRKIEFKYLNISNNILTLHYLGVPMASNVNERIKFRYNLMKGYGANDGSCPVTEQLTDHGIVIADPGLDHYLKDIKIIEKTIALFEITINEIEKKSLEIIPVK